MPPIVVSKVPVANSIKCSFPELVSFWSKKKEEYMKRRYSYKFWMLIYVWKGFYMA